MDPNDPNQQMPPPPPLGGGNNAGGGNNPNQQANAGNNAGPGQQGPNPGGPSWADMIQDLIHQNHQLQNRNNQLQAALATTGTQMNQAMQNYQNMAANPANPGTGATAAANPIMDYHAGGQPYNLTSRAGLAAYQEASRPLDNLFDGTNEKFPILINDLQQRGCDCY